MGEKTMRAMEENTGREVDLEKWVEERVENLMNSKLNKIKETLKQYIVENNKAIKDHPEPLLLRMYRRGRSDLANELLAAVGGRKETE